MLDINRTVDAERAFVRIYTTIGHYGKLPMNKTVELSDICTHIAQLRHKRGDLQGAIEFYKEAEKMMEGENAKKEVQRMIHFLEEELEHHLANERPIQSSVDESPLQASHAANPP